MRTELMFGCAVTAVAFIASAVSIVVSRRRERAAYTQIAADLTAQHAKLTENLKRLSPREGAGKDCLRQFCAEALESCAKWIGDRDQIQAIRFLFGLTEVALAWGAHNQKNGAFASGVGYTRLLLAFWMMRRNLTEEVEQTLAELWKDDRMTAEIRLTAIRAHAVYGSYYCGYTRAKGLLDLALDMEKLLGAKLDTSLFDA